MSNLLRLPERWLLDRTQHGFFDNFQAFVTLGAAATNGVYTNATAVDGTTLRLDVKPGGVVIASAVATAGNEDCTLIQESETFLFEASKPLQFEAVVATPTTLDAEDNFFVGLTSGAAANLLVDDGAGVKTSGNSIGFVKVDHATNTQWAAHWRDEADATTNTVLLTAANTLTKLAYVPSATKQRLGFELLTKGSTTSADIVFTIDGVPVYKVTDFLASGNTDVQAVVGVKDGASANIASLNLYSLGCEQLR